MAKYLRIKLIKDKKLRKRENKVEYSSKKVIDSLQILIFKMFYLVLDNHFLCLVANEVWIHDKKAA